MIKLSILGSKYKNEESFTYYSFRYHKLLTVPKDFISDGATYAIDVCPKAWLLHDVLCKRYSFDDGTPCSNWQASHVLSDVLSKDCNRWFRKHTWFWSTFLFGGWSIKKENGWW